MPNLTTSGTRDDRADANNIIALMTKRMADLHRMHSLQEQLRESEARVRERDAKLNERNMNDLFTQAGTDVFELLSLMKKR